jgi:excisionase family DNA binding protein
MQREMMTVKEVAQYLRVGPKNVYRLARDGRIPGTNVTGKWIFSKRVIDEWIESNSRANNDPGAKREKKDELMLYDSGPEITVPDKSTHFS